MYGGFLLKGEIMYTLHYILKKDLFKDELKNYFPKQYRITFFSDPILTDAYFNLAYLDMRFDHEALAFYLSRQRYKLNKIKTNNGMYYAILRLVFPKEVIDRYKASYPGYEPLKQSFENYVLSEMNLPQSLSNDRVLIISQEELNEVGRHVSNYMSGYWYYENHRNR